MKTMNTSHVLVAVAAMLAAGAGSAESAPADAVNDSKVKTAMLSEYYRIAPR